MSTETFNLPKDKTLSLLWDCAIMIEKYHFQVFTKDNTSNKLISFLSSDMKLWKDVYYKELVETDIVCDNKFYPGGDVHKNYGIGDDGLFFKDEYINFRYQLYKKIYESYGMKLNPIMSCDPIFMVVQECIKMLTPYLDEFEKKVNQRTQTKSLSLNDSVLWKQLYYPVLIETSSIVDYTLFDQMDLQSSSGMGRDVSAKGSVIQHFVSECYRYVLLPLYSSEKLMKQHDIYPFMMPTLKV